MLVQSRLLICVCTVFDFYQIYHSGLLFLKTVISIFICHQLSECDTSPRLSSNRRSQPMFFISQNVLVEMNSNSVTSGSTYFSFDCFFISTKLCGMFHDNVQCFSSHHTAVQTNQIQVKPHSGLIYVR